ncbi:helix-turn-helix domain-containing protein [Oerskovia paurometabola]|uniref:Transposase n=1 Tax=Oerskovia paurometabola TaxID=162170 RepID=A0ABW1X7N7_9CELL
MAAGSSARAIAEALGRPASTISREFARNGGLSANRATVAEECAQAQVKRSATPRLARDQSIRVTVPARLELDWSPQQIAAWLRREHPGEPSMWVSHETIYRAVYLPRSRNLRRDQGQGRQHRRRPRCIQRATGQVQVPDLGPQSRDGRPRLPQRTHRRTCLLLRPSQASAARHEREHRPPPVPLPPKTRQPRSYDRRQAGADPVASPRSSSPRSGLVRSPLF